MFFKPTLTLAAFALSIVANIPFVAFPAHAQSKANLIDFVVLNDGHNIKERDTYESKLTPISAKYGAKVIHSYDITSHLAGPIKGVVRINVWEFSDPSTFEKIGADPTYQALIPSRGRIHDMRNLTLYTGSEIENRGPVQDGVVLVDLVVMKEGYGNAERDVYESKMRPLAAKYGFELMASYAIGKKLSGTGPQQPLRLNLWRVENPDTMTKLSADADYIALASTRNKIHDFSKLTMFYARSRSRSSVAASQAP